MITPARNLVWIEIIKIFIREFSQLTFALLHDKIRIRVIKIIIIIIKNS